MGPGEHPHEDYNPLVKEDFDTAHQEYARLRRSCPVSHSNACGGFWALTALNPLLSEEKIRQSAPLILDCVRAELLANTDDFELGGAIRMSTFPEHGPWHVPVRFGGRHD